MLSELIEALEDIKFTNGDLVMMLENAEFLTWSSDFNVELKIVVGKKVVVISEGT